MKKLILLLPAFLLVGCSGAKNVSFKGNLKFDKPLNDEKAEEFAEKFAETAKTANGFKLSSIVEESHGFVSQKETTEFTCTLYSNGSKTEGKTKLDVEDKGVSYSMKETTSEDSWIIKNYGVPMEVTVTQGSELKEAEFDVEAYEDVEELSIAYFAQALGLEPGKIAESVLYQDGKDYAFVYSNKTQQLTEKTIVNGYAHDIKTITEEQLVINVTKDYKIKSGSYFYERATNRDPDILTVTSKVKTIAKTQVSMTVSYGSVSERSEQELLNLAAQQDEEFLVGVKPLISLGAWDGTSAKPESTAFTAAPSFSEVELNLMDDQVMYRGNFSLTAEKNAMLKNIKAEATYLTKEGFKTRTTEESYSVLNQAYLPSDVTTDATPVPFLYSNDPIDLRLTMRLNVGEVISFVTGNVQEAQN